MPLCGGTGRMARSRAPLVVGRRSPITAKDRSTSLARELCESPAYSARSFYTPGDAEQVGMWRPSICRNRLTTANMSARSRRAGAGTMRSHTALPPKLLVMTYSARLPPHSHPGLQAKRKRTGHSDRLRRRCPIERAGRFVCPEQGVVPVGQPAGENRGTPGSYRPHDFARRRSAGVESTSTIHAQFNINFHPRAWSVALG